MRILNKETESNIWANVKGTQDLQYKKYLSVKEMRAFVDSIVNGIIVDGEVCLSLFEYIYRCNVLIFFTRFKDGHNICEDSTQEVLPYVVFESTVYDDVIEQMKKDGRYALLESLKEACVKTIESKVKTSLDIMADSITDLVSSIKNKVDTIDAKAFDVQNIAQIVDKLNSVDFGKIKQDIASAGAGSKI